MLNAEVITQDMVPDLSDITTMWGMFNRKSLREADVIFDTRNCKVFTSTFRSATKMIKSPQLVTDKATSFDYMYFECHVLKKASDIDLSSISVEDITTNKKLSNMLYNCNALPSITFNNVPAGITVEQMRTATSAPSSCEIILNYRNK